MDWESDAYVWNGSAVGVRWLNTDPRIPHAGETGSRERAARAIARQVAARLSHTGRSRKLAGEDGNERCIIAISLQQQKWLTANSSWLFELCLSILHYEWVRLL